MRATGFPAARIHSLADASLSAAADAIDARQAEAAQQRATLIAACKAAGPVAQRALKKLWKHHVPEPIADEAAEAARRLYEAAMTATEQATRTFEATYANVHHATSSALREFASDDRVRQALLWQNRTAVHSGVDWLLRQPLAATDAETRKNERLVASYVQRYCLKNDTIGFFGPVGWAQLQDSATAISQRPGPGLLASRTVYFEYWAMDAVAAKLSADPAVRPFLTPRLLPRFRVTGTTLHYPVEQQRELPPEFAAVLARCSGENTARAIATATLAGAPTEWTTEAEVFEALDELVANKLIRWELEIPTAVIAPEVPVAAAIARIDDVEARTRAEALLAGLERGRQAVAAATTAAELDVALATFDDEFTRVTEASSHRAHGQTYAGRTPIYEDARRDLEMEVGRPVLAKLAAPLELMLQSARWYTYEIAERYRSRLHAIHAALGGGAQDFARMWREVIPLFPGGAAPGSIVGDVRAELRRRWAAVLAWSAEDRSVQRSAAELAPAIAAHFAAPGPGWPAARHHSPDVMIAASSTAAIAAGEYQLVIGELHAGFNTVAEPLFIKQHPHPEEIVAARDADLDRVCVAPVWSKALTRGDYYSLSPRDIDLEHADTRSARPRSHVIAAAELEVVDLGGRLEVRTRDGRHAFDVIAFFEHHLIAESYAAFSLLAPAPFTPRVTIDGVVIARATWRPEPSALAWATQKDAHARFLGARRWARTLGIPRLVFLKTPEEVKPVFCDLDSTIFVELLAKSVRGASAIAISEMLPTVDEAWITDAQGARYTGELRIAAVDPERWAPPT